MPVMTLGVPIPAWNQVVISSVLHGLDMCPETHAEEGKTLVEITGTNQKLTQVLTHIRKRIAVDLVEVIASKEIHDCE
jgi:hypothetical protein